MIGQRGGFLCGTDPARLYSGGKKTRLSTNYSRQTKEKPVLALAQEIFSPRHRLAHVGRRRQTDWHCLAVLHLTVVRLVVRQVLMMSLQPPEYLMTERPVTAGPKSLPVVTQVDGRTAQQLWPDKLLQLHYLWVSHWVVSVGWLYRGCGHILPGGENLLE